MRTIAAIVLSVLFTLSNYYSASAQVMNKTIVNFGSKASISYTGPCDIVSSVEAWYGLRACGSANAIAHTAAINIVRASDSTATDIHVLSNGNLDTATAATFCTATTCTIKTWYNQFTGPGVPNFTQSTVANQATLTFNCIGTLPCATATGSASYSLTTGASGTTQPYTLSAVSERTSNFTTLQVASISPLNGSTGTSIYFNSTANQALFGAPTFGSTFTATAADSNLHAFQAVANSTSSVLNVDGVETTGNAGSTAADNSFFLFTTANSHPLGNGLLVETGMWAVGFTSTQRTNVCKNEQAFWGKTNFPANC